MSDPMTRPLQLGRSSGSDVHCIVHTWFHASHAHYAGTCKPADKHGISHSGLGIATTHRQHRILHRRRHGPERCRDHSHGTARGRRRSGGCAQGRVQLASRTDQAKARQAQGAEGVGLQPERDAAQRSHARAGVRGLLRVGAQTCQGPDGPPLHHARSGSAAQVRSRVGLRHTIIVRSSVGLCHTVIVRPSVGLRHIVILSTLSVSPSVGLCHTVT